MTESERRAKIIELAQGDNPYVEFDDTPDISEGDDNGAYVQAWVWVDFSGTELDKEV